MDEVRTRSRVKLELDPIDEVRVRVKSEFDPVDEARVKVKSEFDPIDEVVLDEVNVESKVDLSELSPKKVELLLS